MVVVHYCVMTQIERELEQALRPNIEASARRGARQLLTRREAARRLGCRSWDLSLMAARGVLSIRREVMVRERVPLEDVERLIADRARREALDAQTRAVFGAGLDDEGEGEGTKE